MNFKIEKQTDRRSRTTIFPFSTHFYREPSRPLDELLRDMRIIKRLGFNTVKLQESWCIDEKREGEVDLSRVEALIEEAEKLGLYIYFGVTMEQAPAWLWRKYSDCRMVYSTGEKHEDPTQYLLPADGKPGFCWDHPGARESALKFIAEVARRLGKYDNILVWNVWQEVGFWPMRNIPGSLGFCYCPYTLAEFRKWLMEKYGDLNELNKAWRTGYGEWEEVEPPRIFPAVPSWIDWRYFMDDVYLSKVIRWKAEAFRRNDPKHRPVMCHVASPTIGSGSTWRYAAEVEEFGSSCYPAWSPFHAWDYGCPQRGESVPYELAVVQEVENIAMVYDYVRSSLKPGGVLWAAEFQGGPIATYLHLGRTPSPEDIRRWVLTALSSGVQALSFWNHRAEIFWLEAYGFGLLDSKGESTPRAEEAGQLAKALNKHPELFRLSRVEQSQVAIIVDEDLWHFTQATGDASMHLSFTIRGIYKMLWESAVWVDFVEASLASFEELEKYKAIIFPFPLSMSEEVFRKLEKYVSSGGILISEPCPGRYDRFGFARADELIEGAEELFGVEHESLQLCHEPVKPPRWTPVERSYGEIRSSTRFEGTGLFKGRSVLANLYVETFKCKTAKPILTCDDKIAGTVNCYGDGRAYLIGTLIGHGYAAFKDQSTRDFLVHLLKLENILPEMCNGLAIRRRTYKDDEIRFLINMTSKPHIGILEEETEFSKVEDLLGDPVERGSGKIKVEVKPFSVRCVIFER
ncbi:MAG: beta-galactosidase [Candidatus Bathyarchaeia archaeon]